MSATLTRRAYSVRGLANWILDFADELGCQHTNMGVNKLAFFAVQAFLLKQGVLLTNAKIEAWEHGPVYRELYQSFKQYGNGSIKGRASSFSTATAQFEEARIILTPEEERFLKAELEPMMSLTASELRAISHRQGSAWHRVWWYKGQANPGMEISPTLILDASGGGTLEKA